MAVLIAGLSLFLGVHSISIVNQPWRDRMVVRLGEHWWQAGYALVAIAGFALIVWGYGLARQEPTLLYVPPVWLRHVALLLLVVVFPLLLAAYLPGRIQTVTKHPMLAATKVWAFAHLLANGMLHDIVLFGAFLAWAIVARISVKRREARAAVGAPATRWNDLIAVGFGLGIYVAFVLKLHAWLFGVSPVG
jgi:uncharacterized membrane protein